MNTFRLPPLPRPQEVPVGGGEASCLHCDCELSTVNFKMATRSRRPTMSLATLAGGGNLPSSHRQRQHSAPGSRVPTINHVTYVATWRFPPVFPPTLMAETSPVPPIKKSAAIATPYFFTQYPVLRTKHAVSHLLLATIDYQLSTISYRLSTIACLPIGIVSPSKSSGRRGSSYATGAVSGRVK